MAEDNGYAVTIEDGGGGWRVLIVDPDGRPVSVRACADEWEARLYSSTVRQHIYWLSEAKFREYYRLPADAGGG